MNSMQIFKSLHLSHLNTAVMMTNFDHSDDPINETNAPYTRRVWTAQPLCPLIGQFNIVTQWRLAAGCVWVTG